LQFKTLKTLKYNMQNQVKDFKFLGSYTSLLMETAPVRSKDV